MTPGSDHEPLQPPTDPPEALEQMQAATQRLRSQGWMVAPLTTPLTESSVSESA